MNTEQAVKRDERTVAVENASFKWAYYFLAWPLVVDALYRQHYRKEEVGDLIAIVCVSGAIGIAYLVVHRAWGSRWPWKLGNTILVFALCMVVALLVSFMAAFF